MPSILGLSGYKLAFVHHQAFLEGAPLIARILSPQIHICWEYRRLGTFGKCSGTGPTAPATTRNKAITMAKEAAATIDDDLLDGLQQARKKKPRYYALLGKGADVVGLIVQKKNINDGAVQKAKTECKGTLVIQGVCVGEGAELTFEVLGAEPSITTKKVKDFIQARTELNLKPQWSVVTQHSAVVDDDNPAAVAPEATPANVAPPVPPPAPPPTATPSQPTTGTAAQGLQARLKELLLKLKEVVTKAPAVRDGLLAISKPAADLVLKNDAAASPALDKLEQTLAAAEGYADQFVSLDPRYKEFLKGTSPDAAKVTAVMNYAAEQATAGAYDKGLAALKRVEPLLTGSATATEPASTSLKPLADRWRQARAAVAAELDGLRKSLLADEEVEADPRLRFVSAAAAEIPNLLPRTAAVDTALKSGASDQLLAAVSAYRKELDGAAGFGRLEGYADEQLGIKIAARSTLISALDEMESSLRNAS